MLALRDIMTRDVIRVTPDTPINDIVSILSTEQITGVPVVANERVLGVISASDIVDFAGRTEPPLDSAPSLVDEIDDIMEAQDDGFEPAPLFDGEPEMFEEYTAGDLMTRRLCALPPETPLDRAAREMVRTGVHRLLVLDDNRLVGIATSTDFLRAVAQGQLR